MNELKKEQICLQLTIIDQSIIGYLSEYEEKLWEEKALEAMRVGVIAIQSASPTLDTRIVEQKFHEVEKELKGYADEFKNTLANELKKYFDKEKGDLPISLTNNESKVSAYLKEYFDYENGKVALLIRNKIGPGSDFVKSFDPADKESVVTKIQDKVQDVLNKSVKSLEDQFSLDKEDSGMSKIRKMFENKVREVKENNDGFFNELRLHLGVEKAKAEEAEKGTQKGRDFETLLYEKVANVCLQLEDNSENVTDTTGEIARSKVGDYIITLGKTSGAPGRRIVIEVKKEKDYKYKDAIEELKQAKENRKADCGIFVFAKGYAPLEMGDFKIDGHDFFCTVDEDILNKSGSIVFLEAAYKISRINIITHLRESEAGEVNISLIKGNIEKMSKQIELMSDLLTKARTIQSSGKNIEETANGIKGELETIIRSTLGLLK